jgi:LysR family transcriptional regulator, transcription activator of glutamate synthase operon
MDIEQLRNFLVVAKRQHFSKAAEEICLSQSSLSKQIDRLEKEFNVKFFDRTTRNVRLTPVGKEFCTYARNIISEVDRTQRQMQEYTDMERGSIVLGSVPIISHLGLTSLIVAFQKAYPGIELRLREAESKTLVQQRQDLGIEAAFITLSPEADLNRLFDLYPLIEDELVLVTWRFHPLTNKRIISLSEASQEKYIFATRNSVAHDICSDACMKAGFDPLVVHESSYWDTISGLVSAGLGVSLVTSRVASSLSERYDIELIRLKEKINVTLALAILKDLNTVRCVRTFREFTLDWMSRI